MKTYYLLLIFSLSLFMSSCSYYFGSSWRIKPDKHTLLQDEKIIPVSQRIDTGNQLVKNWAAKNLPDWKTEGKVAAPRVILGKLLTHTDIEKVNQYLADKKPWGTNGTDWAFNPHGDYDFSEVPLVTMLYLFGDKPELLYSATKENLLNNLLTHSGNKTHERTPRMLGLMRETENHILMGETSRYLKNQWLQEHGDTSWRYDNQRNGLNGWWMACLNQKLERGFFEFNANPYAGYSLTALLTFYTYCHTKEVKEKCGAVLNDVFARYAQGSLQQRRYPPFRRRMERASRENFSDDPVTSIVQTLLAKQRKHASVVPSKEHQHHALLTLLSTYQLPDSTVDLLDGKKEPFYKQAGHGYRSCPEIYSGNADYVLSAGGAQRGRISQISARPIVLFLNDSAAELKQCFHIPGKGKMKHWNMSGVYKQFACGHHPVVIPPQYKPEYEEGGWMCFRPYASKKFFVLVYNAADYGLLAVIPESISSPQNLVRLAIALNASGDLKQHAILPFAEPLKIRYQLNAPKNKWVIESVNGEEQNRKVDRWAY
ncbi:MAG: hypothetical protein V4615_03050 [Bacteroidota bacterium]